LLSCISTIIAFAEQGWVQLATGGWQYYKEDGTRAEREWLNIDGNWYYFTTGRMLLVNALVYDNQNGTLIPEYYVDENGIMVTSQWVTHLDKQYYVSADGKVLRGTYTPDGYYVDYLGAWDQSVGQQETTPELTQETAQETETTQETEAFSNLVYPVDILGGGFGKNSVGGINPYTAFRNNSGKTIKYITLEMTPYNRVGDPVACTIRGYSTTTCTGTGPYTPDVGIGMGAYSLITGLVMIFDSDTDHPYYYDIRSLKKIQLEKSSYAKTFNEMPGWSCVWYNSNIYAIKITKAIIEYMDGTSDTISSLDVWMYHDDVFD